MARQRDDDFNLTGRARRRFALGILMFAIALVLFGYLIVGYMNEVY